MPMAMQLLRFLLRPFGYLGFAVALLALTGAARLLGEDHELGFFSTRLSDALWGYPEVTRRGVQMAWLTWAVLFIVAVTPLDPVSTPWDEVALVAVALSVLWRHLYGARRVEH